MSTILEKPEFKGLITDKKKEISDIVKLEAFKKDLAGFI